MTLPTSILMAAALTGAMSLAPCATAAIVGTVRLTADDHHVTYIGNADGTGLQQLGTSAGTWTSAETLGFSAAAGQYLYVVAWNEFGAQGLQAEITTTGAQWTTTDTVWQSLLGYNDPMFFNGPSAPAQWAIDALVQGGGWSDAGLVRTAASSAPWGDVLGGGAAAWLWEGSFDPGRGVAGYAVYRTAIEGHASAVPEPGSLALAALALSATAGVRRRRRARRA